MLKNNQEFTEYLKRTAFSNCGIVLDGEACEKFALFADMLFEENEKYNLTSITDPFAAVLLHFVDSLTVSGQLPQGAKLCDIGAGAGFPSLPLAIVRPDLKITAIDATAKKAAFISRAAEALGLSNVEAHAARAEEFFSGEGQSNPNRESFDAATARAVASAGILCELAAPAVRPGGRIVLMKGDRAAEELEGSGPVLGRLGLKYAGTVPLELKSETETHKRNLIIFDKISATPAKYPRRYAKIKAEPMF